jgi:hypothetical protein
MSDLNQKVVSWLKRQPLGKKIGRGECWDVAHQALSAAGARSSTTTGDDDDYVWGTKIPELSVKAGDIIQLRNHTQEVTVTTSVTFDGEDNPRESTKVRSAFRPHHTVVVASNNGAFGIEVYEQNLDPVGRKLQKNTIWVTSTQQTPITRRAMVDDGSGKKRLATVVEQITVTVTTKVWAYRPEKK